MSGLAVIVATGDLVHLRRQRLLRSVWAAALVAPALAVIATTLFLPWTGGGRGGDLAAGESDRAFLRRQFRAAHQPAAARGGRRSAARGLDRDEPRASASAARRHAGTDAVAVGREIQRDRRRRGLARLRHVGTPPPDIAQRFPGLVPEVPRAFEWLVTGRQPLLRIGWAIVRPKAP